MTNPTPPKPGGIPTWAILLIVAVLVLPCLCFGAIRGCFYIFSKGAATVGSALNNAASGINKIEAEQAQRVLANGGAAAPTPQGITPGAVAGGAIGNNTPSTPAIPSNNQPAAGSLPANFPTDLPTYKGFTATPIASDNLTGAGSVMFKGAAAKADVQAFYRTEMKNQGWTITQDGEVADLSQLFFEKDQRTALVQIISDKDHPGQLIVNLTYEKK